MITAEKFIQNFLIKNHKGNVGNNIEMIMIEFAQMHVKAALEEASYNAVLASYDNNANKPGTSGFTTMTVNGIEWRPCSKSILNSYPLTNIK